MTNDWPARLMAGPDAAAGAETLEAHWARLGPIPRGAAAAHVIPTLEASGLLGRGGAGFPVGRKWRALAERVDGGAVVVVNGAEGEPRSAKDRMLMSLRPHLVIDGAIIAADAIGADEIVIYAGEEHHLARNVLARAIADRRTELGRPFRLVAAPIGYVSGEASAAVHCINAGDARPTHSPPRPSERGVRGQPTLVQNVESLAYAALIARFGDDWYRSLGRSESPGTALVTVTGAGRPTVVHEIELGTSVAEVAAATGAHGADLQAVLLGGYFGTWADAAVAWDLALDPSTMRSEGLSFGCGVVAFLPRTVCGVSATARVIAFLARESAGQCGPCVFGLGAVSDAIGRLATGAGGTDDMTDIARWNAQIVGRGACRHPDGAVQMVASAIAVFGDEFERHARTGRCSAGAAVGAA